MCLSQVARVCGAMWGGRPRPRPAPDVHQDDIGEFLVGNAHRAIGPDVAGAYNRDFLSQDRLL